MFKLVLDISTSWLFFVPLAFEAGNNLPIVTPTIVFNFFFETILALGILS